MVLGGASSVLFFSLLFRSLSPFHFDIPCGFQLAAFSLRLSARSFQPRVDHAWQVQKTEPSGVAESHAVKKKKKDGNQAVSAVTAAFPAKNIKRKGPKQQVVASDLCGWKPYVAAHSFQLQAMYG